MGRDEKGAPLKTPAWEASGTKTHRDFFARSAPFKNSFSNLKLVSEVNCSNSSNICLICSRLSLKRLKDINKNAISTR